MARSESRDRDRRSNSRDRRRRSRSRSRSTSRRYRNRSRSRSIDRRSESRDRYNRNDRARDRDRGRESYADRSRDRSRDHSRGRDNSREREFAEGRGGRGRGRGRGGPPGAGRGRGGGRGDTPPGPWPSDQMMWDPSAAWGMGMWPSGGPPPPPGWIPPPGGPTSQMGPGMATDISGPPQMWNGPPGAGFGHPPPPQFGPPPHGAAPPDHRPPARGPEANYRPQDQHMAFEMPQISALAAYAFDVPLCRDLMSDNGFQDAIQQMYPEYSLDTDRRLLVDEVSDVEDYHYESASDEEEKNGNHALEPDTVAEAKTEVDHTAAVEATVEGAEAKSASISKNDKDDDDDDDDDLYGDIATEEVFMQEPETAPDAAAPTILSSSAAWRPQSTQQALLNKMKLRAIGAPVTKERERTVRRLFYETSSRLRPAKVEPVAC